jgi:trehalose synthase-fused probable maltokinase
MSLAADRVITGIDTASLERARWFAGKGLGIRRITLRDAFVVPGIDRGYLLIVDVRYAAGGCDRYLLPALVSRDGRVWEPEPGEGFWVAVVDAVAGGGEHAGESGVFALRPEPALATLGRGLHGERALGVDQSNTSIVLGERLIVKCYRRLEPGTHPEIEVGDALTNRVGFPHVPAYAGTLCYRHQDDDEPTTMLLLQAFVPDGEDGWEGILGRLVEATHAPAGRVDLDAATDEVREAGALAAALHGALADAFGVSAAAAGETQAWRRDAEAQLDYALGVVAGEEGAELAALAPRIRETFAAFDTAAGTPITRIHGDLHYAQFLRAPTGLYIVDFEGEPTRTMPARRRPLSPLRDLACLVRSIDHIGAAASRRSRGGGGGGVDLDQWVDRATGRCVEAYRDALPHCGLVFDEALLRAFEVEKETYEFVYAARFLPSWMYAPQLGMRRLLAASG